MSQVRFRITSFQQQLSYPAEDLNQLATARHISLQLGLLLEDLCGNAQGPTPTSDAAVRLDLSELSWLGSVALNELINMNRMAKNYGLRFVLENIQDVQREVFTLTRAERMFEFESTLAADTKEVTSS